MMDFDGLAQSVLPLLLGARIGRGGEPLGERLRQLSLRSQRVSLVLGTEHVGAALHVLAQRPPSGGR
jgi:hypothetical protein